MLDVHPPEHGLHGIRDFTVHLLTITVGLVIALGLENGAEALHHRHQGEEAERLIRAELTNNRATLQQLSPQLKEEYQAMRTLEAFLLARSRGAEAESPTGKITFHEGNIPDSAWRTAASTGALSYLNYDEVQRFSDAYKQQDLLQRTAEITLDDYLQLLTMLGPIGAEMKTMSKEDAASALPAARRTLGHLSGIAAVGQGTIVSYDEALK